MQVIDQINGSALFAQSAYSASVATKDNLGRDITSTYLTSHQSLDGYATTDWVNEQGYITEVNIPESATWQDVSTTVQTNSAQWGQGGTGGDEEVNSFVYNNSADILDVDSTYQENSASYLTSHQDISYKLDTTAFSTVSGDFLTAAPSDMATTGDVAELAQSVSETYQVKGDYLTTADSANFYPANNPSGFITGVDLSNFYTKDETSGKEELADAFANVPTPDYEVESYIHNNSATLDNTSDVVQSNSSTWSDVTAYQSNSSTYITAHQSLEGYATEQWVGEQGYLTEISIPESGNWNEATTTVQTNSSTWDNVTNKLDTTSFSDVSSTFLTAVDLTPYQTIEGMTAYQPAGSYATTNDLEQVSGDITAMIPSTAGLASESYVQTNSAVLTGMIDAKQDTLTFGYDGQDKISAINNSAIAGVGSLDIVPISGTGAVDVYEQNNVLWVSGKDFTGDISYISGVVGDVETLLASL